MKRIDVKTDELEFLKRNWSTLKQRGSSIVNEAVDFLMATVEKDLDMVIEKTNKSVLKVNTWLKNQEDRMHQTYTKVEQELEKDLEAARMDDEGGAGFINTLPHETSPNETSSVTAAQHKATP